jgi:hypothetical protein
MNTLMIHQALGRAVLQYTQDQAETEIANITTGFVQLMKLLAPNSDGKSLNAFAEKVVKKGVALKRAMVEEQALYYLYWVDFDAEFEELTIELEGDSDSPGNILFCTFPGLERMAKEDYVQAAEAVIVVKARALSESTIFEPEDY